MFKNLFKSRKKPSLNSIKFDNLGWNLVEKDANKKVWLNEHQTAIISFHFFDLPPDLPAKLNNIESLRNLTRQNVIQSNNGGLIKLEAIKLKNFHVLEQIIKVAQERSGNMYLGAFTIPFKDCSFVINIQAVEAGTTGMREAMMGTAFLSGQLEAKTMDDLRRDPYDPTIREGNLMTIFEEEKYDERFQNHPLSLVRRNMKTIASSIQFGKELTNLEKF